MDNIIAESSNEMVNSLNFGLPATSQYIVSRRFANFFVAVATFIMRILWIKTVTLISVQVTIIVLTYPVLDYLQHFKTLMAQETTFYDH